MEMIADSATVSAPRTMMVAPRIQDKIRLSKKKEDNKQGNEPKQNIKEKEQTYLFPQSP